MAIKIYAHSCSRCVHIAFRLARCSFCAGLRTRPASRVFFAALQTRLTVSRDLPSYEYLKSPQPHHASSTRQTRSSFNERRFTEIFPSLTDQRRPKKESRRKNGTYDAALLFFVKDILPSVSKLKEINITLPGRSETREIQTFQRISKRKETLDER